MADLTLYDLAPSPNNIKVRLALGYKGLDYERVAVRGDDRAPLIEVSGQPLTPVLIDRGHVICDSGAILRYLDANFRDTPRLWSADYAEHKAHERWEQWSRTELIRPIGEMFDHFFSERKPADQVALANRLLAECAAKLEEALDGREWLVADHFGAADACCASLLFYGMLTDAAATTWGPISAHFKAHLTLPAEGTTRVRAWVRRAMAYDRDAVV